MSTDSVLLERHGAITVVRVNRPPANAITLELGQEFEAAFEAFRLQAELIDELGEFLKFSRRGAGVDAAEEMELGRGQSFGDGFVGGQHEFFDDLMAFGVFGHVGAADAAFVVELDFHFGHDQFQGSALEAPPRASGPWDWVITASRSA